MHCIYVVSQLVVVVVDGLPGVLGLRQLHQELLHPGQSLESRV